jgi:hypothetical protein
VADAANQQEVHISFVDLCELLYVAGHSSNDTSLMGVSTKPQMCPPLPNEQHDEWGGWQRSDKVAGK